MRIRNTGTSIFNRKIYLNLCTKKFSCQKKLEKLISLNMMVIYELFEYKQLSQFLSKCRNAKDLDSWEKYFSFVKSRRRRPSKLHKSLGSQIIRSTWNYKTSYDLSLLLDSGYWINTVGAPRGQGPEKHQHRDNI